MQEDSGLVCDFLLFGNGLNVRQEPAAKFQGSLKGEEGSRPETFVPLYQNTGIRLKMHRSQWPRKLRRRSSAARLLRLWFRIPPGAWILVCCECCVLSGRDLCDGLITRPEESYRLWRVVVYDQETPKTRRLKPATGL